MTKKDFNELVEMSRDVRTAITHAAPPARIIPGAPKKREPTRRRYRLNSNNNTNNSNNENENVINVTKRFGKPIVGNRNDRISIFNIIGKQGKMPPTVKRRGGNRCHTRRRNRH
jgi:hypothetical protein